MKRLLSIFVAMLMVTTMLLPGVGVFAEEAFFQGKFGEEGIPT